MADTETYEELVIIDKSGGGVINILNGYLKNNHPVSAITNDGINCVVILLTAVCFVIVLRILYSNRKSLSN